MGANTRTKPWKIHSIVIRVYQSSPAIQIVGILVGNHQFPSSLTLYYKLRHKSRNSGDRILYSRKVSGQNVTQIVGQRFSHQVTNVWCFGAKIQKCVGFNCKGQFSKISTIMWSLFNTNKATQNTSIFVASWGGYDFSALSLIRQIQLGWTILMSHNIFLRI